MRQTMRKPLAAAAVTATALLALAGCSSGSEPGAESGASEGQSAESSETSSSGGSDLTIGFATPTASETYWTAYVTGVEEKAEELGVDVTFTDARNDANTQLEQVNSLIVSGVDGIVLAPVDTTSLKSAGDAVNTAGIPLVTSNRALDMTYGDVSGDSPKLRVGFNGVAIGEVQGQLVVDACEGLDPCNVAMLLQPLGSTPQIERSEGAMSVIDQHSNIKIVAEQSDNNDANTAMDLTRTILQQNPDLNVVASQYDPSAIAASQAVQEAGRAEDVKVIGVGGSKDGIQAVESGALEGTVWVSPKTDGATALEVMVAILRGEDLESQIETINGRPTVPVELVGVTKENADAHPGEW